MISLLPASSPVETTAAYTLLAVLADPKAAKQRLDELVAEKQSLEGVLKDVQKAQAEHEGIKATAEKLFAGRENSLTAREAALAKFTAQFKEAGDVRAKQLEDHSGELAIKHKRLDEFESTLTARESDLAKREAAVKSADAEVTAREVVARKTDSAARQLKAEYDAKHAALQAALSATPKTYSLSADTGQLGAPMGGLK